MSHLGDTICAEEWRILMIAKTNAFLPVVVFALMAAGVPVQADTLNGGGTWQTWNTSVLSTPKTGPYWNGASWDGPTANIGYCLVGGGTCSLAGGAPGALAFYGNGDAAVSNIFFSGTGGTVTISFLGSSAAFGDTLGWYSIDPANANLVPTAVSQHALVGNAHTTSPSSVGGVLTFTPTADYGFYLNNGNQTFFSQSSLNEDSLQHFAVFTDGSGSYYIGSKDYLDGGDMDFQDLVVKVTPSADDPIDVPEPLPTSMIGAGLILLGGFVRHIKRLQESMLRTETRS